MTHTSPDGAVRRIFRYSPARAMICAGISTPPTWLARPTVLIWPGKPTRRIGNFMKNSASIAEAADET